MADVGQIILQAAQNIVAQNQNRQRMAAQAAQMGMQLQQANRTFQLQREELDMRKSMQEQREEEFKLAQEKTEISRRAVDVQEGQLQLQKDKEELYRNINMLTMQEELRGKKAETDRILADINSGQSPASAAKTLLTKSPGTALSIDKAARQGAIDAATTEFLTKGQVVIGEKTVVRPKDMPLLRLDEIESELSSIDRALIPARTEQKNAQMFASLQAGKSGMRAELAKARLAETTAQVQQLEQQKANFNRYALSYQQLNAASGDEAWKKVGFSNMGAGDPLMQQFLTELGIAEAPKLTTPEGRTLMTPTQRLSFIGGAKGSKAGKFENYTSETGSSYGFQLRNAWESLRLSEPGAPAWDSGMGLLKSLSVDAFDSKAHAGVYLNALRQEWGVDSTDPQEEQSFQRIMRAFFTEKGVRNLR
jgi:hypothetical protein